LKADKKEKFMLRFSFYLLIAISVCACSNESDQGKDERSLTIANTVAQVGEHVVTEADIDAEFLMMPAQYQTKKDDPKLRVEVLKGLLDRLLLVEKARQVGIVSDPATQAKIERARQSIMIAELERRRRAGETSDAEIQHYYEENKALFIVPEQVQVRQVLVNSGSAVASVLRKLGRGESFESVVERMSIDKKSKTQDGELKPFSRGMMLPAIEAAAFALKEAGDLSDPVQTPYGFHVLQLMRKLPERTLSLDEARDQVEKMVRGQSHQVWLEKVRNELGIRVLKDAYNISG